MMEEHNTCGPDGYIRCKLVRNLSNGDVVRIFTKRVDGATGFGVMVNGAYAEFDDDVSYLIGDIE